MPHIAYLPSGVWRYEYDGPGFAETATAMTLAEFLAWLQAEDPSLTIPPDIAQRWESQRQSLPSASGPAVEYLLLG